MKQFSRFLAVGLFNTTLGYCIIFTCMYLFRMSPESSNVTGYAAGLLMSYVLNRNYTFKSRQRRHSEIIRFLAVFGLAYGANFAVLLILIHGIDMHKGLSQLLAGMFYVGISFLMHKHYVFKPSEPGTAI